MVAGLDDLVHVADEVRETARKERDAAVAVDHVEPFEMVLPRLGEPPGDVFLVIGEDVDGEVTRCLDRERRPRAAGEARENHHRLDRDGGEGIRRHPVPLPFVHGRQHAHTRRKVAHHPAELERIDGLGHQSVRKRSTSSVGWSLSARRYASAVIRKESER